MMRTAVTLSVLLVVGCSGEKKEAAPPPADAAPAAVPDLAPPVGDFNVPECDRFAKRYLACLDKVPEASRAIAKQAFEQTIEQWRFIAEKPERRANLAAACVEQEKATQAAMSRYDCEW